MATLNRHPGARYPCEAPSGGNPGCGGTDMPQQQPLLWVRSSEALGVLSKSESRGLVVQGTGMGVNSKDHSQVPAWHLCPQGCLSVFRMNMLNILSVNILSVGKHTHLTEMWVLCTCQHPAPWSQNSLS